MKNLWRRSISLNYGDMRIMAACYVLLPVALFFIGFLRWYYAVIGMAALGVSFYSIVKSRKTNILRPHTIELRVSSIVGIFAVMLLWCQLGGLNGYGYQTGDFNIRNAVFRDLITHRWPVVYESSNSALVYYVGHWLPPALIGKLADLLFHNVRFTWFAGRMALWAWTSLGLTLIALLLFLYVRANTSKKKLVIVLIFIFFSGLDLPGVYYVNEQEYLFSPEALHLEWWPLHGYQYTSVTACLYWVFNQAIVPWIVTLCFLMDENEQHYVTYGAACMICSPMPLVGLIILMITRAVVRFISKIVEHDLKSWVKSVFSLGNISILILCFPVLMVYLFGNNAIAATGDSALVQEQGSIFSSSYLNKDLFSFYLLEVGCYLLLVWNAHKKNPLFYIIAVSLFFIPYFHIGYSTDFCMRASIPGVFIILAYTAKYVIRYFPTRETIARKKWFRHICAVVLTVALLIGTATPLVEIYRGFYHVYTQKTYQLACDTIITLDDGTVSTNFSTSNADQQFFFKYLAR